MASPECTPAFSICSDTAMTTTSPSLATASTSISYIRAMFKAESDAITPWVVLSFHMERCIFSFLDPISVQFKLISW